MAKQKTVLDVMVKARELIAKPENWTRRTYARSAQGCAVEWNSKHACAFCTLGALKRTIRDMRLPTERRDSFFKTACMFLEKTLHERGLSVSISGFNDVSHTKHRNILKLFDDTIKRVEKERKKMPPVVRIEVAA